jgi:hypothetical protein
LFFVFVRPGRRKIPVRGESVRAFFTLLISAETPASSGDPYAPHHEAIVAQKQQTNADTAKPQLFGGLKNLARRMLEAFRYIALRDQAFDPLHAASIQIRFDTS